ncbi:hypothetical protein EYF80_004726 [Liparis tanakae]|uniref:Uncharacterized protein n=1 Tax=Liparis tanakae TaxID=230148 RepID=A0A4Z2J6F5_9TELE|nr:hypothetical protein EYF80_004726 [Liparis tanakae]
MGRPTLQLPLAALRCALPLLLEEPLSELLLLSLPPALTGGVLARQARGVFRLKLPLAPRLPVQTSVVLGGLFHRAPLLHLPAVEEEGCFAVAQHISVQGFLVHLLNGPRDRAVITVTRWTYPEPPIESFLTPIVLVLWLKTLPRLSASLSRHRCRWSLATRSEGNSAGNMSAGRTSVAAINELDSHLGHPQRVPLHGPAQVQHVGLVGPLDVGDLGAWNHFDTAPTCPHLESKGKAPVVKTSAITPKRNNILLNSLALILKTHRLIPRQQKTKPLAITMTRELR